MRNPYKRARMIRRLSWAFVTLFCAAVACIYAGCGASQPSSSTIPKTPQVTVTLTPTTANVRLGNTQQFTADVSGASNQSVTWTVNGVSGGSAAVGTVSTAGLYTAPASLPNPDGVQIKATSTASPSAGATTTVNVWNPTPAVTSVSPSSLPLGTFSITVNGSQFVGGAQVMFGGSALPTTFVSSTQLTASGTAPSAGTFSVAVSNPDPGSSTSSSVSVQVTQPSSGSACSGIGLGQGASLNGFVPFPSSSLWNQNISNAAVDPNSDAIINFIGGTVPVHPDFGAGEYQGSYMGIPYMVVGAGQATVPINFTAYGDESDPGPMPIPATAPIEGYPNPGSGDRHVLVLDNQNCWLYELYSAYPQPDGSWNAGSAAIWDLLNNEMRPYTWTSADAAGLPIFPGLLRYDEMAAGHIDHALRFTLQNSRAAFVPPASHWAANSTNPSAAPMGMRLRLKQSFDISGFSATNQVILTALKQYGLIMADNGSSMYITGTPDDRWNNDDLHLLGNVTASDFEVIEMNPVYTASNLPQGESPAVNSFSATPSTPVSPGASVTLDWSLNDASYVIITPAPGPVRGTSVVINPAATTTYTLIATNQFGRTTASVTVTVQ